uniref:Ig-like domain-containing protein n=1 Tax=Glossina brevipalpis TaxID=37001 RepID=A0A1A9WR29_9MUSC
MSTNKNGDKRFKISPKVVAFDFGADPVNFEDSVSVNCLISSGDMPVDIIWLLNNNSMDSYYGSGVNIMKSGKRASVLTIDSVHAGHVGNYTCLAKNRAGQAGHTAELIVNVPPKITPFDFGDEPANFGDSVTVQCTISKGDLPADITWLFNEYPLNDYLGVTTSKIGKKVSVLTIDSVNGNNAGNYTCKVRNIAQVTEYTATLVVNVPPKISPFSTGSEAVHLGQYITYQCTITEGDLPLNILWTFNNQPLFNDDHEDILIAKMGRRSSVLTIESVTARNAGNYTCQGSNKAGKASYTVQLRVIVLPRIRPFTFEDGPAQTGQYISLSCSVTHGDLPLNITWFLNYEEVDESYGITTMMVNKRTSVLTIESVDDRHAGNFTCLARNPAGRQLYTTELNIYVLPKIAPFNPGAEAFFPGDYSTFQCSIIHGDHPMLIYWYFNQHKLNETNAQQLGIQISKMGSRSSVLTIESVNGNHAGNYTCFGKNSAGVTNYTASLIVNVPPKLAPLPSSADSPLYMGDYFQLNCAVVHGDAPFNITWFYNDEPVNKLDGITILMQSKRSSSLNIESVRGEHAGKYTCMGANRAGVTEVFTHLIVKELPQLEQFYFNANGVNGGQAVRVMCMVTSGDLPIDIHWLKDGQPLLRSIYHKIDEYTLILSLRQTNVGDSDHAVIKL